MNVNEAIVELQKIQLAGGGKKELLQSYDGMVQEIESFAERDVNVRGSGDLCDKRWIPHNPEYRGPDSDYENIVPAIKIKSGTTYRY